MITKTWRLPATLNLRSNRTKRWRRLVIMKSANAEA